MSLNYETVRLHPELLNRRESLFHFNTAAANLNSSRRILSAQNVTDKNSAQPRALSPDNPTAASTTLSVGHLLGLLTDVLSD